MSEYEALKQQVIVKLTMLIGACRISTIKKKDIEQSIERFIKELEKQKSGTTAKGDE